MPDEQWMDWRRQMSNRLNSADELARVINLTNSKAVIRVDEVYSFSNTRPVAGGDLDDLKHTKIQNACNPTEFFQRGVLSPQGNFGVESSFQTPLAASFELQLRF